jgi:hypothetical protein
MRASIRQRRFDAVLALRAVHLVEAARHVTAVQTSYRAS